jgi:hypothetical protein
MQDLWLGREGDALHLEGAMMQPPLRGCLYEAGTTDEGIVTDQLTLTLESTAPADFAAVVTGIESHLAAAQLFATRGLGHPVWLGIRPLQESQIWRAQLLSGRLDASGSGQADRLRGRMQLRLSITRQDFFEGFEVELPLSNRNGAHQIGGITVHNHADSGHDNHVLIDGADLTGDLPACIRLAVTNAAEPSLRDLIVCLNAHSNPTGFTGTLEAESGVGGTTLASTDCSGGSYQLLSWSGTDESELLSWLVNAGWVADAGGNVFRYLLRLVEPVAAGDMWLKLRVRGGADGAILGETDWALVKAGECLQELGPLPLPPGQLPPGATGMPMQLALVVRRWSEGDHTLAFDHLALLALDGFRRYRAIACLPQNGQLVDDPTGGVASFQPGSGWLATHQAIGAPLVLIPGISQRLTFFQDEDGGLAPIERRLCVRAWYRPRRSMA